MENDQSPVRYAIYARKSLESEDRQVQSIEDQLTRLREIATQRSLIVAETLTEARSAKSPGTRAVFDRLLSGVEKGEFDGILCWQVNRLSRNPIDSGRLSWLLQRGILRSIHTTEREYRPEDNVLLLSVETGMANQFVLDLSRNVKRGILGKLSRGELPGKAPAGYANDRLAKVVLKDSARFPLIRKAWDLMLLGIYSVADIRRKLHVDLGFRHRGTGRPISLSSMHRIFSNPFYAGLIRVNGRLHAGKHEAMISRDDFERVQRLIHGPHRPRPSLHRFTYSRLLRCGECGCMVTAEHKTKRIRATGALRTYTYYHCTGKRASANCKQKGHVREEVLTAHIAATLEGVSIADAFRDYALNKLKENHKQQGAKIAEMNEEYQKEQKVLDQRGQRLIDLCIRGVISEAELTAQRNAIETERQVLEVRNRSEDQAALKARRIADAFAVLAQVDKRFREGSPEQRRIIVAEVGSNWTLRDGKPLVALKNWCLHIADASRRFTAASHGLEPSQNPSNTIQNSAFALLDTNWSTLVHEVGNLLPGEEETTCLCFRCFKRNRHRCPEECPPQMAA